MATAIAPPCDETRGLEEKTSPCPSRRGTLVATVLGSSLAFVVGSIVNVALPAMRTEFAIDAAGVQWIVNAYLLPLGALVLVGGALGDRYGRKRLFMVGLAVFTLACLGCALAPDFAALLTARFAQGVGAALLAPNSLAIIADAFSGKERGRAIGTWAGAGAIAGAVAPLIGGLVIDNLDWRWAFALVVPPGIATAVIGWRSVAESREDRGDRRPLDIAGAVAASVALAAIVYALIAAPGAGLAAPNVLVSGAIGVAAGAAFIAIQHRKRDAAMMPLSLFAVGSFSGISLLTLLLYAALGGLLVVLPYMLIQEFGYSATQAGAAIMPFPLIMGVLSRRIGALAQGFGIRRTLAIGPSMVAAGFVLMALRADPGMTYWNGILPGLVVMALGMAISVAPLTTAVMNAVDAAYTGVASGVNNAISRVAGLIATAMLGPVLARPSLIAGFELAAWVAAALAALGAGAAWLMVREREVAGG
jgi:EmrB/QacA subfamily drug resistance transporter